MSLRLEMLQVARLAPKLLGPEASRLVADYVRSQQAPSGGFRDRDGEPDLYYTSFALDALTALQEPLPEEPLLRYLETCQDRMEELDFVHLCCLARCGAALRWSSPLQEALLSRIESFRSADGGYNQIDEADTGSTYAAFLARGAYSDLGVPLPEPERVASSVRSLAAPDGSGAWANDTVFPVPNVPATAAAVSLARHLRMAVPAATGDWLLGCFHLEGGGFLPFPGAPMPDLLSTAVALHALDGLQVDFSPLREGLLDYIDGLWTAAGGFHGSWGDDDLDIEYTYYGLLALGHLAI